MGMKKTKRGSFVREGQSSAVEIVNFLNAEAGEDYKANWTGAWDKGTVGGEVRVVTLNVGHGHEEGIVVPQVTGGVMQYVGPFDIEVEPTDRTMLLFYAKDGTYIEEL